MRTQRKTNVFALAAGILLIAAGVLLILASADGFFAPPSGEPDSGLFSRVRGMAIAKGALKAAPMVLAGAFLLAVRRRASAVLLLIFAGLYFYTTLLPDVFSSLRQLGFSDSSIIEELAVLIPDPLILAAAALAAAALLKSGRKAQRLANVAGGVSCLLAVCFCAFPAVGWGWQELLFALCLAAGCILAGLHLKDAPPQK